MSDHINKLFLAIIVISLFTYFERADYNLPLFAFTYLLWNHHKPNQKARLWYLMVFSLLIDFIWVFYWAVFWNREDFSANNGTRLTSLTVISSVLNIILKMITIIWLYVRQPECKRAVTDIVQNFRSVFVYQPTYQQL